MPRVFLRFLFAFLVFLPPAGHAQSDALKAARILAESGDTKAARAAYEALYERAPGDPDVYTDLFRLLLQTGDARGAEKLVEQQQRAQGATPLILVDAGRVQALAGKSGKAEELWNKAIDALTGDDLLTTGLAGAFSAAGRDDYAIKTYERARELLHNSAVYGTALARLYAKTGALDKAVAALLDGTPLMMGGTEETKATLLELIGDDPKRGQAATKVLVKRIQAQPENYFYADILTWLYAQRGDWDGALLQVQALDERGKEDGRRLLEFGRTAVREKQYATAAQAFEAVMAKGTEGPLYAMAGAERLTALTQELQDAPKRDTAAVVKLLRAYEAAFGGMPYYYATPAASSWAMIAAQYANNPEKGITILKRALDATGTQRDANGRLKLQLGDYYVLTGEVWEASLLYSQVDKTFREDALGEEARFRNARLSYYRGDFEYAQGQLSVLKASTSELIANDALHLSVLITENIPPDSNILPLRRFAAADLLLFQNRDAEAAALLDSVATAFPEHPLEDDILMLRAKIAERGGDYTTALGHLKTVYEQHGKDVLADDAVFKTAELYERILKNTTEARRFYEQLILDYPGSTYVQIARNRLSATPVP